MVLGGPLLVTSYQTAVKFVRSVKVISTTLTFRASIAYSYFTEDTNCTVLFKKKGSVYH
jgi:hypothetical protein